jgi:hypothetical protein
MGISSLFMSKIQGKCKKNRDSNSETCAFIWECKELNIFQLKFGRKKI